jgi:DNA polymerase III subunit epsilon
MMRQIVLDTETTGLNVELGHRIIEIGCVELINRKLTGRYYQQYINPERQIDEGAHAVHGISNQFLLDKPTFKLIAQAFMEFIGNAELIIHNASFDVGFINHELSLADIKWKPITEYCHVIDTLQLARQLHAGQRNNLDTLCKRYGIDNSQRELHGALLDANLLAAVYLAMTGGQGTLFDEIAQPKTSAMSTHLPGLASLHKARNLCVIKADPDELALHEQQLKIMASKSKCLWLYDQ